MRPINKNKKAISEIVAYVLLIVIALSLAVGVYAWLKAYVPPVNAREKCPDDVSISISDYTCSTTEENIILTLENKGLFNVDGFFILASSTEDKLPNVMLNTTELIPAEIIPGTYFFNAPLKLGEFATANFSYTGLDTIKRLRIQPFVNGKSSTLLCSSVSEIRLENC